MGSSDKNIAPDTTAPNVLTVNRRSDHEVENIDSVPIKPSSNDVETQSNSVTPVDSAPSDLDVDEPATNDTKEDRSLIIRLWEVFKAFWILGFIGFGGPQAHVAIFRDHLIIKRQWYIYSSFFEIFMNILSFNLLQLFFFVIGWTKILSFNCMR